VVEAGWADAETGAGGDVQLLQGCAQVLKQ